MDRQSIIQGWQGIPKILKYIALGIIAAAILGISINYCKSPPPPPEVKVLEKGIEAKQKEKEEAIKDVEVHKANSKKIDEKITTERTNRKTQHVKNKQKKQQRANWTDVDYSNDYFNGLLSAIEAQTSSTDDTP